MIDLAIPSLCFWLRMQLLERLDLILNERVLTELTTAAGIADEFWVVVMETQPRG